jgi:hypothetical protein
MAAARLRWISSRDCIDRPDTSAPVVIVGRRGVVPATLWVIPGEPLTAIAVPAWVEAGASPAVLATEQQILDRTEAFLAEPRDAAELATFQEQMAELAFVTLRSVR